MGTRVPKWAPMWEQLMSKVSTVSMVEGYGYLCLLLTGVFTQSELGLLNNGELSPSPQFSFPKLTSSRSARISSVDRARIMGEQGSDLRNV